MKAALLICDHVPARFKKDHGNYQDMFSSLFPELELVPYRVVDGEFPNPEEHELYIITGSKHSVYEDLGWIIELKKLVRAVYEKEKKLAGICFGHQVIAESLGGKVERSGHGYLIGIHSFSVEKRKEWMEDLADFKLVMLCQDQVERLPPGSEVLAGSEQCPVGMYTVGNNFLGIQGHPEFTTGYNRDVFMSRQDKLSPEKINKALQSFEHSPDREAIRKVILNFLDRS